MATSHELQDGDELDRICFDHYGFTEGVVELVMRANHSVLHLFDNLGRVSQLDQRVSIVLPDIQKPVSIDRVNRIFD